MDVFSFWSLTPAFDNISFICQVQVSGKGELNLKIERVIATEIAAIPQIKFKSTLRAYNSFYKNSTKCPANFNSSPSSANTTSPPSTPSSTNTRATNPTSSILKAISESSWSDTPTSTRTKCAIFWRNSKETLTSPSKFWSKKSRPATKFWRRRRLI